MNFIPQVTGYMFGKGIYFADMCSKSANYCFTSHQDPVGFMLLSEVALGNTHDLTQATYVEKLPKGKHSAKGIGKTQPNPKGAVKRDDGTVVPMGKPITKESRDSSLLYNEFIVYDTAQVNLKYLLKVKFDY
jgi:poly [ADP-ribose] polymerase 1